MQLGIPSGDFAVFILSSSEDVVNYDCIFLRYPSLSPDRASAKDSRGRR
jgi:hypothetical protein